MVSKRLENVAPFNDALTLLSSRLPPLSPTMQPTYRISSPHINARPEAPSSRYSTVFHWHAVPSSSLHHTRRFSCYSCWNLFFFLIASLSLFHFSYFSLIYSYSFLFGKPFWFGKKKKQRCLWNFDGHFPIQPSCTLLCFSCIISTRQKRCLSDGKDVRILRCPSRNISLLTFPVPEGNHCR